MVENSGILAIRDVLARMDPKSSASAAAPLPLDEIYTPTSHGLALDPRRPLVVGNRGVGKSVWSGVLADNSTRQAVSAYYPALGLDRMAVQLGFHEGAGKTEGIAPSPAVLSSLLSKNISPETIWSAVLLRAVAPNLNIVLPEMLEELVAWMLQNVEKSEEILRKADQYFASKKSVFVLVFDALDRLASNWHEIRRLTEGVLRLALGMQSYRSLRAKVFLRTDQAKDEVLFRFPDASKMRASRVELTWHAVELYGLLFKIIQRDEKANLALQKIAGDFFAPAAREVDDVQKIIFSRIAGEFMGSDHRRGRTYTWLINHLADAFGETTPRSFLITLNRAANSRVKPTNFVIDHLGIREGVQAASEVRVDQLGEDYPWIRRVLKDLEGLEVPCPPSSFTRRWADRKTIEEVRAGALENLRPGPLELENSTSDAEVALLDAVKNIGVVEERSLDRVNMPDIFRVAAGIKRRGGVRPPFSGKQRS